MRAQFADDIADTSAPAVAAQAAGPTEVQADGQVQATGSGAGSAATRRGTGPVAASAVGVARA